MLQSEEGSSDELIVAASAFHFHTETIRYAIGYEGGQPDE